MLKKLLLLVFILLLAFVIKAYYDTNAVEIRHYHIRNSSLGEVLEGLKVAHLSDLHIREISEREKKVLEILKEERPDLILVTGDFINFKNRYEPAISFLQQLKAPLGLYAVLGNTEYSNENGSCILCHRQNSTEREDGPKPVVLRNTAIGLNIKEKTLNIIGVDDPVSEKSDLKKSLQSLKFNGHPSILLSHSPEIFEEASQSGVDLVLSGHTHGGQIFILKYLRKVLPLDAALEFIEGFFQKGRTLMYVSRGVGTSFLPFRLGVKPEITFLDFSSSTAPHRSTTVLASNLKLSDPPTSVWYDNPISTSNLFSISNTPPSTVFAGLTFSNFIETFNVLKLFGISFDSLTHSLINLITPDPSNPSNSITLFDFESEAELERLNRECGKWLELSGDHVTSGEKSLRMILPAGQYPGINFKLPFKNWSKGKTLWMDVYNPSHGNVGFHVRIDDNNSGWEYADRFDINFTLKPGLNNLTIPTDSIRTNMYSRPLNLKRIQRMMVFVPNNQEKREFYLDNIRLE